MHHKSAVCFFLFGKKAEIHETTVTNTKQSRWYMSRFRIWKCLQHCGQTHLHDSALVLATSCFSKKLVFCALVFTFISTSILHQAVKFSLLCVAGSIHFPQSTLFQMAYLLTTQKGNYLSPVCCVPLLCSCVGDLLSIFHPEAFFVRSLGSGEVALQGNWFSSAIWQDDLVRGIDLWFCKTKTVKPYHRNWVSKLFKCSHPCFRSCRLCAVFIWSV